ncbi:MAG: hypothetical protein SOZ00_03315 [Tidjanibacter sp.]|nr:hypothetical protein [Tidjanibacter sp.]
METSIILAIIAIVAAPITAWLTNRLDKRRYKAEISRLNSEVARLQSDTKKGELENVRRANEILMEQIVEPLERQIKKLSTNVSKLEKAIGQISACPHAADCPVNRELLADEKANHDTNSKE